MVDFTDLIGYNKMMCIVFNHVYVRDVAGTSLVSIISAIKGLDDGKTEKDSPMG